MFLILCYKLAWYVGCRHLQASGWCYDPGDTIGVVCPNDASEVRSLMVLLGLSEKANVPCSLAVMSETHKRNAVVPDHLPVKSTLFSWLRTCCEIREVPRKVGCMYSLI